MSEEFYIGYLERAPSGLRRFLQRRIVAAAGVLVMVTVLVATRQAPVGEGRFEYGIVRTFEGRFLADPLPLLQVDGPGTAVTNYGVVGPGKHGVPETLSRLHGQRIRIRGSLIERDGARMIEWNDLDSLETLPAPPQSSQDPAPTHLGELQLTGELVDTKCYFGVMRPGSGKVHRACAVRCLSGGVPAGLLVRREDGQAVVVLLVGEGKEVPWKVSWAGREIRVRGRLERRDTTWVLRTDEAVLSGPRD